MLQMRIGAPRWDAGPIASIAILLLLLILLTTSVLRSVQPTSAHSRFTYPYNAQVIPTITLLTSPSSTATPTSTPGAHTSLDPSFGYGGITTTDFPFSSSAGASAVVVDSDGRPIVIGSSFANEQLFTDFTLQRYTASGMLDSQFGEGGYVATDFYGRQNGASAAAIQGDGRILAGGYTSIQSTNYATAFAFARYNSDGTLDSGFGNGGKVTTVFADGEGQSGIIAMAVQSDGKILAAGYSPISNSPVTPSRAFTLARYNSDGTPDEDFGAGGVVTTTFSTPDGLAHDNLAKAIELQPDGKIVVAGSAGGYIEGGYRTYIAVARYTSNGSLDPSFDNDGMLIHLADSGATSLGIQSDGRIAVGGGKYLGTSGTDFLLARYNGDGTPDTTFGPSGAGYVTTNFTSGGVDFINALRLEPGGRVVAVGSAGPNEYGLARYDVDGSLDSSFASDGTLTDNFGSLPSHANALALVSSGYIVAGNASGEIGVARYTEEGNVDTSFGSGGKVTNPSVTSGDNEASAMSIQGDGGIVVAGYLNPGCIVTPCSTDDFAVARYLAHGDLDPAFGQRGRVTTDFSGASDKASAVVVQSDGKIVAGGRANSGNGSTGYDFAIVRYNTDGSTDPLFGSNGRVTTDFAQLYDGILALAVQTDSRIIAAGAVAVESSGTAFGLARYLSNGALDPTFGTAGKVSTAFSNRGNIAYAVALQPDGKIVAGGQACITSPANTCPDFALARYLPDGSLDTTFGTAGKVTTDLGTYNETIFALAIQPNGKIIAVGHAGSDQDHTSDFVIIRYNADGTLDADFGVGGKVATNFNGSQDVANAVILQGNGKIVVAGYARLNATNSFALARYNADGSLDFSFGTGGKITTGFQWSAGATGVGIQPDNGIVAAGYVEKGNTSIATDFALARYAEEPRGTRTATATVTVTATATATVTATATHTPSPTVTVTATQPPDSPGATWTASPTSTLATTPTITPSTSASTPTITPTAISGSSSSPTPTGTSCSIQFTDAGPGTPFYDFVMCLACRGILSGYSNPSDCPQTGAPCFKPNDNITRGQAAKIVANAAGYMDSIPADQQSFTDVPSSSPFWVYIERVYHHGAISGYSCGGEGEPCPGAYYRPGAHLSRGQLAKIVTSVAGFTEAPTGQTFNDVPPDSPFYVYIERAHAHNVISGYRCGSPQEQCPGTYYRPALDVTRGQAAKIIANALLPECQVSTPVSSLSNSESK